MHNPESIQENKTHKLLCDFEIQMDHLISARQPHIVIVNKKKRICWLVDFGIPVKLKESERRDKYDDLARELKKTMEHESDVGTHCNWCSWNHPQRVGKETGILGNTRTSGHHQNFNIIKIGQNTEKSPRALRRLGVTQTPAKSHRLTLVWKTHKRVK